MRIPVIVDTHAWIPTSSLREGQLERLQDRLTLQRTSHRPGESPPPVLLYAERFGAIGLPRAYFERFQREEHVVADRTSLGVAWGSDIVFHGDLFDVQRAALGAVTEHLGTHFGCLLEAAPGFGKTVSACAIMAALRRRAMVVVHKEFLANQWTRQLRKFLPKARIGRIQGDVCDTEADVVVAMVHTLVNREWSEDFLRQFGVFIGDEVHRSAAETWTPVTCVVPARYRVGLSATFRRKDGCERVFFDHIGPVVFSHRTPRLLPTIHRVNTGWSPATVGMDRVRQITAMVRSKSRNKFIAKIVASACAKGRKVMVLSERLEHLQTLAKLLPKEVSRDFYVGGRSEEELGKAELAQVVLATRQNVEEALDIPALDTLIYATPLVDPEQSGGRTLRPFAGKRDPVIVDLRDGGPMLEAFARKRDEWYRILQWEVPPATHA